MMAKRGRRGEDGTAELSKPVPGSSERAFVSDLSNAIDEIKTHSASPQVFRVPEADRQRRASEESEGKVNRTNGSQPKPSRPSTANRPTPRRQRRLRPGFAFRQCSATSYYQSTNMARRNQKLKPARKPERALSRKRQRHTRNPNADHSQNPVAPVVPPVSSGVHRRRCGARRGASGKVRVENSYRNWSGGADKLAPNSNQCCERDFKTRNRRCRTTRGDPDFSAALSRCGVVRCDR